MGFRIVAATVVLAGGLLITGAGCDAQASAGKATQGDGGNSKTEQETPRNGAMPESPRGAEAADRAAGAHQESYFTEPIDMERLAQIDTSTPTGEELVLGLLMCQSQKVLNTEGQAGVDHYVDMGVADAEDGTAAGPTDGQDSLQAMMMQDGYSCSMVEIQQTVQQPGAGVEE